MGAPGQAGSRDFAADLVERHPPGTWNQLAAEVLVRGTFQNSATLPGGARW